VGDTRFLISQKKGNIDKNNLVQADSLYEFPLIIYELKNMRPQIYYFDFEEANSIFNYDAHYVLDSLAGTFLIIVSNNMKEKQGYMSTSVGITKNYFSLIIQCELVNSSNNINNSKFLFVFSMPKTLMNGNYENLDLTELFQLTQLYFKETIDLNYTKIELFKYEVITLLQDYIENSS